MTHEPLDTSDVLIQRERRGILGALAVIILLGAAAIARWASWDIPWTTLGVIGAVVIVPLVVISSISPSLRGHRSIATKRRVVRNDEVRRSAMDRACRYALITLLTLLCIGIGCTALWPVHIAISALLASFVAIGATVFLVAFLLLDRSA